MKRHLRSLSTSLALAIFMVVNVTAQTVKPAPKTAPSAAPPKAVLKSEPKVSQPDLGVVENSLYTNDYFKLRIPIPAGWNVHDAESKRRIMQTGNEELTAAKPEMSENFNQSLQRTLNLLAFDNLNVATPEGGAAAMLIGAELIPAGQTMTALQYMETTKRLVLAVSGYEMIEEIHLETIGGAECGAMTVRRTLPAGTMKQKYVGIIRKGYAIFLVTAYTSEDAGRTLDDVLKKSKFN